MLLLVLFLSLDLTRPSLLHSCFSKEVAFRVARGNTPSRLLVRIHSRDDSLLFVQEEEGRVNLYCSAYLRRESQRIVVNGIHLSEREDCDDKIVARKLMHLKVWLYLTSGIEMEAGILSPQEERWFKESDDMLTL